MRTNRSVVAAAVTAAVIAAGVGLGLTGTVGGSPGLRAPGTPYSYYRTVMGGYRAGPMMGGSDDQMMGISGYRWMTGGSTAPGWMRGGALPGFMMGPDHDPGRVMGRLFAHAPGRRLAAAVAARLGDAVPPGARVDRAAGRIDFTSVNVRLVVLASPTMPAEDYRIAGMVDPTIVVARGARVGVEVVNADPDMAHGFVVTTPGAGSSWMPMTVSPPAFHGAALWWLGDATAAGMHTGTIDFVASRSGTYRYLCPVPGHARDGMIGSFVVSSTLPRAG